MRTVEVLEAGVTVEPASEDDQPDGHHVVNGQTITLLAHEVVVTDATGSVDTRVRMDEITVVNRSGLDVIVVRGYHDPVTLRFAGAGAAAAFERSLRELHVHGSSKRLQQRWWAFWRRS